MGYSYTGLSLRIGMYAGAPDVPDLGVLTCYFIRTPDRSSCWDNAVAIKSIASEV